MSDLIYRQAAIDALERIFDRCEEIEVHLAKGDPDRVGYKMYPDWLTVWKYLHQLPSAQPERKKGHWIKQELAPQTLLFCSLCGCKKPQGVVGNFCPNCGADMRGSNNEYEKIIGV